MAFFNNFSIIPYKFDLQQTNAVAVVNLLTSAKFLDSFPERSNKCYVDYLIKDGEKPEHIAERVYQRPDYHWVVLMSNKIYNPYYDWPLSSQDLDSYVYVKYPGVAIFYDCVGTEATQFYRSGTNSLLTTYKSHFVVGGTLTQNQGNKTVTGTIVEWDPTFRKLVVDNVQGGSFSTSYVTVSENSDQIEFQATPKKIVNYNADAVHHFIDDFNNYLDPYAKINYYEYDDNRIYATKSIFYNNKDGMPSSSSVGLTGTNDFMLNKYINGSQNNTITNRMNEEMENDFKRNIKVLRPEFLPAILKQFEKLFK
jgi:hypothetical protein